MQAQEKLKLQSKELKDALQQRKLAMSEYTEVTDKLSELRQHKQKLSRQVHVRYNLPVTISNDRLIGERPVFLSIRIRLDFLCSKGQMFWK
jgi:flagellar biosynthesis chaperone FliJ